MFELIKRLTQKPKVIFIVDGLGAFITAFFLFAILREFHEFFGMPQTTVTHLSVIAVIFCLYSITCFIILKENWQPFLRIIIIANILYCCLTMGLVIYYFQNLTVFGFAYFLGEIFLICGLVFVELKILSMWGKENNKIFENKSLKEY